MGDETFSDKTALVTGASRGIGRAVALGLASAGADLALLARSQPELDEVAGHSRAPGARVVVVPTDLADRSTRLAAIHHVQKECGLIDILINNAAVVQLGPTVDDVEAILGRPATPFAHWVDAHRDLFNTN